jgi:hypothetical protein
MLNSFTCTRKFDYPDFEKRLRHYFTDSAPINADIVIGLREVTVSCHIPLSVKHGLSCHPHLSISCGIDERLNARENVKNIIDTCIENLYPRMTAWKENLFSFSDEQKKAMLLQGLTVEQIHGKEKRPICVRYILIRFNEHDSTIDYIEEITKARYRAHLYQPLMMVKDKIWTLASGLDGGGGMEELYRYVMSISKRETLEECGIQEFL